MKTEQSEQQHTLNDMLESETLQSQFKAPILLVTYDGTKKADSIKYDKFELHIPETIHKTDVIFALSVGSAELLGDGLRINKKLAEKKLRTARLQKKRHKQPIKQGQLKKSVEKELRVLMRSGHVLLGTLLEYNEYNFTMNVSGQLVLVYRHAVHHLEGAKEKAIN